MDSSTRKYLYDRCKPEEALGPADDRNVDIDALGEEGARARGVNWVERLASEIRLAEEPMCELFSGLRGSGKSTELRRLAHTLRTRSRSSPASR